MPAMDPTHQNNGDVQEESDYTISTTTKSDASNVNTVSNTEISHELCDSTGDEVVVSEMEQDENELSAAQIDSVKPVDEPTGAIEESGLLLRLEFANDSAFDELATVISSRIREALASLDKTVSVSVDKANHRVDFAKVDNEDMFMIDTLPTDKVHRSEVPNYKSVTEALKRMNANKKEVANDANDKPKAGGCWNCGGDHNMRECKEPVNRDNISRGKQMFHRTKTERYHLDAEQKFAQFMPGTISESLRAALGLRQRELPLYIYKMRLYGYPPGWLEEAKVTRSGLTLFNAENSIVPDTAVEDGEVDKVTFDSKQFISFPGFNAAVPDGFIDDTNYYRVPAMQFQHSCEGLKRALASNLAKSYKRKKLKLSSDSPAPQAPTTNEEDMEIESDSEATKPALFPMPRPNAENSSDSADTLNQTAIDEPTIVPENALDSPADASLATLTDLEEQKQKLLQALANANENSNSNSSSTGIDATDTTVDVIPDSEEAAVNVTATDDTDNTLTAASPSTPNVGRSREVVVGTPLLKGVSPFSSLPSDDKWAAGVSGVIDFENLPDATGTYKKLRGLISTVRTVVKQINDQNDAEEDDDDS